MPYHSKLSIILKAIVPDHRLRRNGLIDHTLPLRLWLWWSETVVRSGADEIELRVEFDFGGELA